MIPRSGEGNFRAVKPLVSGAILSLALSHSAAAVDFEKDVWPILKSNCIECHSDKKQKGDLNLEPHKIKEHIGAGLQIVPGRPTGGLLIKVVESEDPDNRMPPKGSPLDEKEVQTLKTWISQGAELGSLDPDAKPDESEPGAPEPAMQVWTNKDGKQIKAALLKVEGDKAVLRMENGKIYNYPIANLSEESQAKVKESNSKAGQ